MKATSSRQPSSLASQVLKLVGIVVIVSALLDYVFLLIPGNKPNNIDDAQWSLLWQQNVTSGLIDRGIIPLVGLAILFAGLWIERNSEAGGRKGLGEFISLGALILSAILGLAFLLPIPLLNFNSLRLSTDQTVKQINQQATQAKNAIQAQSQQVDSLIKDPQKLSQLEQAVKSGVFQGQQLQGPQLQQLQAIQQGIEKFKQDPNALKKQVETAQTKVKTDQMELEKRATNNFIKTGAKNVISSLLLAIGYVGIGWMGLTNMTRR